MSDSMSFEQVNEKKLPSSLNVLTILTFIGSGFFGIIGSVYQYFSIEKSLAKMEEVLNGPDFDKMPEFAKKMYSPESLDLIRKTIANKLPITLLSIVAAALCIYGAMQMRQLKMTGYFLYIIGCILPFITTIIFIGTGAFSGIWAFVMIGITILFMILYTIQRKYLVNK